MDTSEVRTDRKSRRALLSAAQINAASVDINAELWHQPFMSRSRRIAAYFAVGGEVDCSSCFENVWKKNRELYLPVICDQDLAFAQYCAKTPILSNRFGIPEPVCAKAKLLKPSEMDVVLTPLVAFDDEGNRIGMGSGFYDRSFRFMRNRTHWLRPRLVGLAYEFQKTAQIKASSWDVPLHNVVTEKGCYTFR